MADKGLIIVVSAPSGAGKSTLCGELLKRFKNLRRSISCTTRAPRTGEKNKLDYFFVSREKFKKMVSKNQFAEWALVHGHCYGTPKYFLNKTVSSGKDVVLNIDVQGALKIKRKFPEAVMIFIEAPSLKILEQRLRKRKKDSEQTIRKRLKNARVELKYQPKFGYLVINKTVAQAVNELSSIIIAEHKRLRR
jgi:guanylate kinase